MYLIFSWVTFFEKSEVKIFKKSNFFKIFFFKKLLPPFLNLSLKP